MTTLKECHGCNSRYDRHHQWYQRLVGRQATTGILFGSSHSGWRCRRITWIIRRRDFFLGLVICFCRRRTTAIIVILHSGTPKGGVIPSGRKCRGIQKGGSSTIVIRIRRRRRRCIGKRHGNTNVVSVVSIGKFDQWRPIFVLNITVRLDDNVHVGRGQGLTTFQKVLSIIVVSKDGDGCLWTVHGRNTTTGSTFFQGWIRIHVGHLFHIQQHSVSTWIVHCNRRLTVGTIHDGE
mmetsp:Transcript_32213/g.53900  ORF Transcript_32213/g.53900 Transcript_32213/m.53900 type:complete len:235 (+) Transcript_32213:3243-3947(+)